MSPLASVVTDIEQAVSVGDTSGQAALLKRLTGLFVEQAPRLGDAHIAVFDEAILRLSRDIEFRARVELAETLADLERAPPGVIRDLAHDEDAAVAGPVIERSPGLPPGDLLAIAAKRGQEHLLALTRRRGLHAEVTDVLMERGDAQVVRSVAANETAAFSDRGRSKLAHKAVADPELGGVLRARRDYEGSPLARMVDIARTHAQERLRSELGGLVAGSIDAAVDGVVAALTRTTLAGTMAGASADGLVRVMRRARGGDIDESLVVQLAREGAVDDALAALAYAGRMPIHLVNRAYHAPSYDPLLFVVRALGYRDTTFTLLLGCKTGRDPSPEILASAADHFRRLGQATAQAAIRAVMTQDQGRS